MSAGLSSLFLAIYFGCNWITARRQDVGTWYYAWEHLIPFVPAMVVPYMSIDLFFVAAPFLCRDRVELNTLARRMVFAILVAGAFFLLMPLKMGVPRPQPAGWTAPIFRFLNGVDRPFNLFPSLHITIRTILAALYARHTKGIVRWTLNGWFSLIGFSTLLTWQHHVADIAGGFVLAVFCFYLFREDTTRKAVIPNYRIGAYYAFGSVLAILLAVRGWLPAVILLWLALSLAITVAAYAGLGPAIFRKQGGRLPFSARLVLAPNLIGQYLSLLYYRTQSDPWNQVTPKVWIGRCLTEREARDARSQGVTAVLDLTAEFSEALAFRDLVYRNIPILDLTQATNAQLREGAAFIATESGHGVVYVHCKVGYSRSAAVIGAWLLESGQTGSVEEALDALRLARPGIVLRPEVTAALEGYLN